MQCQEPDRTRKPKHIIMENPICGHNHREERFRRGYMLSVCRTMMIPPPGDRTVTYRTVLSPGARSAPGPAHRDRAPPRPGHHCHHGPVRSPDHSAWAPALPYHCYGVPYWPAALPSAAIIGCCQSRLAGRRLASCRRCGGMNLMISDHDAIIDRMPSPGRSEIRLSPIGSCGTESFDSSSQCNQQGERLV
eukprot:767983-Hanusia_phi.AAC.7